MACYTPKVIWDSCENNLMKTLVMGLNIGVCPEEEKCQKKEVILGYLMKHVKVRKIGTVHKSSENSNFKVL